MILAYQYFHSIAGSTEWQHHHYVPTKFALLDAFIIKEAHDVFILLATVNDLQQIEHFFLMPELLVTTICILLDGQWTEKFLEGSRDACLL